MLLSGLSFCLLMVHAALAYTTASFPISIVNPTGALAVTIYSTDDVTMEADLIVRGENAALVDADLETALSYGSPLTVFDSATVSQTTITGGVKIRVRFTMTSSITSGMTARSVLRAMDESESRLLISFTGVSLEVVNRSISMHPADVFKRADCDYACCSNLCDSKSMYVGIIRTKRTHDYFFSRMDTVGATQAWIGLHRCKTTDATWCCWDSYPSFVDCATCYNGGDTLAYKNDACVQSFCSVRGSDSGDNVGFRLTQNIWNDCLRNIKFDGCTCSGPIEYSWFASPSKFNRSFSLSSSFSGTSSASFKESATMGNFSASETLHASQSSSNSRSTSVPASLTATSTLSASVAPTRSASSSASHSGSSKTLPSASLTMDATVSHELTPTLSIQALRLPECSTSPRMHLTSDKSSAVEVGTDFVRWPAEALRGAPACFNLESLSCHTWCLPSAQLQRHGVLSNDAPYFRLSALRSGPRAGFSGALCGFRVVGLSRTLVVCLRDMAMTYRPATNEVLHFRFNTSWFCNSSVPAPVTLDVFIAEAADAFVGLGRPQVREAVLIAAGGVTAITGHIGAVPSAQRQKIISRAIECPSEIEWEVEWIDHILGFAVGRTKFRYHLGAAIGNTAMLLGTFVLHLLLVIALAIHRNDEEAHSVRYLIVQAAASLRFPGRGFPVGQIFFQPALTSVFIIILHYDEEEHRAVYMLLAWISAVLVLFVMVVVPIVALRSDVLSHSTRYVPLRHRRPFGRRASRSRLVLLWLQWFFLDHGEWIDVVRNMRVREFTSRYGSTYEDFKPTVPGALIFDSVIAIAVSAFLSYYPADDSACSGTFIFGFLLFLAAFAFASVVRPFCSPSANACYTIVAGLQLASAAFVLLAMHTNRKDHAEMSEWLTTVASFVMIAWCAVSLLQFVNEQCGGEVEGDAVRRRADAAEKIKESAYRFHFKHE